MILVLLGDDQFLVLGKRWVVVQAIILNRNLRMKSLAFILRGLRYWQMGLPLSTEQKSPLEINRGQIQFT
jgi:hypothetical protein